MKSQVEQIIGKVTDSEYQKAKMYCDKKIECAQEREKIQYSECYKILLVADIIKQNRFSSYTMLLCEIDKEKMAARKAAINTKVL